MTARLALVTLLSLCTTAAHGQAPAKVEQLAWLAGCWAAVGGEAGSSEQWMAPAGGTMFGIGRTVRGGVTRQHEFMQWRDSQVRTIRFPMKRVACPLGVAR